MNKIVSLTAIDFSQVSKDYKWYTIVTKFNYEFKFERDFLEGLSTYNLLDDVQDLFIPAKKFTIEYINAKNITMKREVTEKVMSLYVFIKANSVSFFDRLFSLKTILLFQ